MPDHNTPKRLIKKFIGAAGFEVHRKPTQYGGEADRPDQSVRSSLTGILHHAQSVGFSPTTVIDVGAAFGLFSAEALGIFPQAKFLMVEPLAEYEPYLEAFVKAHPKEAQYAIAAAGPNAGEISINVHPDLVGSSIYLEEDVTNTNGVPRLVKSVQLDDLVKQAGLNPPFLLKIDVQGAELEVLAGFEENLTNTEFLLLEVSFFGFFIGGPQFYDVVAFMKSRGFVVYDVCGLQYRLLDGALSQTDLVFVKEDSRFRREHYYATAQQRAQQFGEATRDHNRLKKQLDR